MKALTFDTLKEVKNLRAAGFVEKQAEAIVSTILNARVFDLNNLATKGDLYKALLLQTFAIGGIIIAAMKFL